MAMFPKIQSPCPFVNRLTTLMHGDVCGACERQVFDLTAMSDGERVAFMKGCTAKVCVSYKMRMRPVVAAAVLAAAIAVPTAVAACDATGEIVVVVGGINDPANTEYIEDASDSAIPVLPVVHENDGDNTVSPSSEGGTS
jgi:predicted Fe-S protein YdhL (DUF1289 family)